MKAFRDLMQRARESSPARAGRGSRDRRGREELPFFLFLTLVLVLLYGYTVNTVPELRAPGRLIPFTLLMLAHGVLHWISPRLEHYPRWVIGYLVLQGALAFALTMLAGEWAIISLYTALIGEAVGLARDRRLAAAATVLYLALAVLSFLLISDRQELLTSVVMLGMAALFSVFFVVLYNRQADARERAQALLEELEIAHRQLAEYATRVEDLTLAAERERMARELHDTLAQGLAGLILQLEAAQAHLESGRSARANEVVDQAMAQARATLREARQAIADLREDAGDAPDLATSVRREVDRFTEATGIPCQLALNLPDALPQDVVEHARRIVAEGLVNVARHAQATQVWLRVDGDGAGLEIALRDDGRGFDPAGAIGQAGHYGLLGIRERARLVGGTFEVESAPKAGATLHARLPF
jgi:NarL family two-component system sensor histidine kinase YdfH